MDYGKEQDADMAINFPASRKEVIDRIETDVQAQLPQSNPFLRNSFLNSLMVGYGGRVYEFYLQLMQLLIEMFPDTATGDFLARWGSYMDIVRNAATIAQGFTTATGTLGSIIPAGTQFQSDQGNTYTSQSGVTITNNVNSVTLLTFSSGTVSATTASSHNYSSSIPVTISGAVEPEYNGTFVIQVTGLNTFTYEIDGSPSSPATGIIQAAADTASVFLHSDEFGQIQNLGAGAALDLTTPILGVNTTSYVQFDALAGGTDDENDNNFRIRVLDRYQNPNTPFNAATIIQLAKTINGVTRVFVEEPDTTTGNVSVTSLTRVGDVARAVFASPHGLISGMYISMSGANETDYNVNSAVILVDSTTSFLYLVANTPTTPATGSILAHFAAVQPGQVKVLFTRDNDPNIIPTFFEVAQVKAKLLTIKPAHTAAQDLIVEAPFAVPVNFIFTATVPDTATMQAAIKANLEQFFREDTVVGENLLQDDYRSAIQTTIDLDTGEPLKSFVLSTPIGDITIQSGQIPTLGAVTF